MGTRLKGLIALMSLAAALGHFAACGDEPGPTTPSNEVSGIWAVEGDSASVEYKFESSEWDHEIWVNEFGAKLLEKWEYPYAYRIGVVSGFIRIGITVGKNGNFPIVAVLDSMGHASLHDSAKAALQQVEGTTPIPDEFGGSELELELLFDYPAKDKGGG